MLTVPIVTTWGKACGIAEHAYYLKEAIERADPDIELFPVSDLHPRVMDRLPAVPLIILNYQAALLSQWTPEVIRRYRQHGTKVISIYHDSGVPSTDQCKAVVEASDVTILHEATTDLPKEKIRYWRMGVPAAAALPYHFSARDEWAGSDLAPGTFFKSYRNQPVLGSIGFPFPWKCYDQIVEAAASVGWAVMLIAPGASLEQVIGWKSVCPDSYILTDFVTREHALQLLSACDATAFTYVCQNGGQSGAILQGIAARKPVIAFRTCRQFRSLFEDADYQRPQIMYHPAVHMAIRWCESFEDVAASLRTVPIGRVDSDIVALAEEESWKHVGEKYAALIRELTA